jgi:hypothetical protein
MRSRLILVLKLNTQVEVTLVETANEIPKLRNDPLHTASSSPTYERLQNMLRGQGNSNMLN